MHPFSNHDENSENGHGGQNAPDGRQYGNASITPVPDLFITGATESEGEASRRPSTNGTDVNETDGTNGRERRRRVVAYSTADEDRNELGRAPNASAGTTSSRLTQAGSQASQPNGDSTGGTNGNATNGATNGADTNGDTQRGPDGHNNGGSSNGSAINGVRGEGLVPTNVTSRL